MNDDVCQRLIMHVILTPSRNFSFLHVYSGSKIFKILYKGKHCLNIEFCTFMLWGILLISDIYAPYLITY